MEDRDVKKHFVIPKTYGSTKGTIRSSSSFTFIRVSFSPPLEVLIPEKIDSRNVAELFDDIKSCALETQFDFRPSSCKSCDLIRNPKLQKLYTYV